MVKRWQNLIHKKCPHCDERLLNQQKGYVCPACGFYISKRKVAEILTDPTHAAVRFLSNHEKEMLEKAIEELGLVPTEVWGRGQMATA